MQEVILSTQNMSFNLVSAILIAISIVGMSLTLLWFCIYKKTIEYTNKNARALETIDYTPVLRWILNLHTVSLKDKKNTALLHSFDILFRNYYEMYGERFTTYCKQTTQFLDNNSSRSWPMLTNFILARELNKKIELLRLDARETVANTQDILEMQTITRNWYIRINQKANFILELIKKRNEKQTPLSAEIWSIHNLNENKIMILNEKLQAAKQDIMQAKYPSAIEYLKEISLMLGDLTLLIDNTDKINNLIDVTLRDRLKGIMTEIKGINLSEEEKIKNTKAFVSLENSYWAFVKATKMDIYTLKIDEAYKRCIVMIDQIKKHESNLKYEMLLKTFIKSNYPQLQNVFNHCHQDILKTLEIIEFNNKIGEKTVAKKQKLDEINKTFTNLREKANTTFNEQTNSRIIEYAINHKKKGKEIKDIYERIKVILKGLSNLRNSMKSADSFRVDLESKIISLKKMLLVTEFIIAKNPNILELKKSIPVVQELFSKLHTYEDILHNDPEVLKSQSNIDQFSDYLDEANSSVAKLKTEMAQNVFIAKLAEMTLAYVARFGGIETIDMEIQKSIDDFDNSRYRESLNKNMTFLKEMKNSNRGVIA